MLFLLGPWRYMILSTGCLYLYKTADDQNFTEAIPLTKCRYLKNTLIALFIVYVLCLCQLFSIVRRESFEIGTEIYSRKS